MENVYAGEVWGRRKRTEGVKCKCEWNKAKNNTTLTGKEQVAEKKKDRLFTIKQSNGGDDLEVFLKGKMNKSKAGIRSTGYILRVKWTIRQEKEKKRCCSW